MAFIYRYEVEDRNLRKNIDLRLFDKNIIAIIEDFFNIEDKSILKSIGIYEDYFEYRLHLAADINILTDVNMRVELFLKEEYRIEKIDFKRITNKYIGFIKEEDLDAGYDKISSLELIDYNLYKELNTIKDIKDIDVFTLRFKDRDMTYYFSDSDEFEDFANERFIIVEGNYGNNFNYPKITSFMDRDFLEKFNDRDREIYGYKNYTIRNFNISDIRKPRPYERIEIENISNIFKEFDNSIGEVDRDYFKNYHKKDNILGLLVYDVGQALRSAVYNVDNKEEIYFDMGIDKNSDILNYKRKTRLERDRTVILSHLHLDHWHMLNVDIDAYYQDYFFPNQEKGFLFSKRAGEILDLGKKINYISKDIELDFGKIYIGDISRYNNLKANHKHETGLYSLLKIGNKNILLSGDHRYEFMLELEDIDILVASHHGGDYSEFEDMKDYIPLARNRDSIIVYSYGENNPYGHPNRIEDYRDRGWLEEHYTSRDGDYILK